MSYQFDLSQPTPSLTPLQFAQLRDLLSRYCGVYIDDGRRKVIEHALQQRLRTIGTTVESYIAQVSTGSGRAELQRLAELAVNHETMFFRNSPQFEALRRTVLPELHRRKPPGQTLRLWSAGCATGEEAYSLAISVLEALGNPPPRPVQVWATDLSTQALAHAEHGHYAGRSLAQVRPELLRRYFTSIGNRQRVAESVRRLVRFEQLNLLEPFNDRAYGVDIIFCQNVTIYFQIDTCRTLMDRFFQALPEGGLLFLGFSETLWQIYERFQLEQIDGAFVYVKREQRTPNAQLARRGTAPLRPPAPVELTPQRSVAKNRGPAVASRTPALNEAVSSVDLLHEARQLVEQGRGTQAIELLRRISPESHCLPAALTLVARIHADRGDLDTALAEARRAIAIDPLTEEAYLLLGLVNMRLRQWSDAITQFERARYLNAHAPLVRFHLAEAYRQAGREQDARREYRNVLHTLEGQPDQLLDGVSVEWLRETCRRYV